MHKHRGGYFPGEDEDEDTCYHYSAVHLILLLTDCEADTQSGFNAVYSITYSKSQVTHEYLTLAFYEYQKKALWLPLYKIYIYTVVWSLTKKDIV